MRFIVVMLFIFTSVSANAIFDNCSCPVVTCEPCQVQMALGREAKSCGIGQTIQCEKTVCENVDNYFQCIAGDPALFIPPQQQKFSITEPQLSNVERVTMPEKNEINFSKINASQDWEDEPSAKESDAILYTTQRKIISTSETSLMDSEDYVQMRNLASESSSKSSLKVMTMHGDIRSSTKVKINKGQSIHFGQYISALKSSQMALSFGSSNNSVPFTMDLQKGTELHFSQQDDFLIFNLIKGEISLVVHGRKEARPFIFDLGQWRVGKRDGGVIWKKDSRSQLVKNQSGSAWLRKDELMTTSTELLAGQAFELDPQQLITHFQLDVPSDNIPSVKFKLNGEPHAKFKARGLAAASDDNNLCQAPSGQFEQCAWKCFGGKNKKICDTSQASTQCVRFTCSANGEWKLPTFSAGSLCDSTDIRVGSCQ